jgi:hypothetical protein
MCVGWDSSPVVVGVMSTGLESRPTEGATMYDGIWSGMGEPIHDWGRFAVACVIVLALAVAARSTR